ncbi:hypothetical protein D0469_06655 [Peribacillus saganii]|uniref:Uncharacterized protein n=1 Tax=Peribacillus saganii TaxID=2303992 RepID=A0A372LPY8_9BACI|nr:hypothetical protein D0469_06655 [Peribacillus saganii]
MNYSNNSALKFSEEVSSRYNIAPSQQGLTLANEEQHKKGKFRRGGLITFFTKDINIEYKMILNVFDNLNLSHFYTI